MEASRKRYLLPTEQEILAGYREDFWRFCTSCVFTFDEDATGLETIKRPFPRYPYLLRCSRAMEQHQHVIFRKPRQMLLSWLVEAFAVHRALFNLGERVLTISKREKDAFHLKDRAAHIVANLPDILQELLVEVVGEDKGHMEFAGGSSLIYLPTSPDIGRSYTASGVIYDEFAFHKWADDEFGSLHPTLGENGWSVMLSTANGVGNEYHRQWTRGTFHKVDIDWHEHPERDQAWYEKRSRELGPRRTAQEIDKDFLQSGSVVFKQEYLQLKAEPMTDAERRQAIKVAFRQGQEEPFLHGVDTAEGLPDGDWSVHKVVERETGRVVQTLASKDPPDVFARKSIAVAKAYPGPVGIEKASTGAVVILKYREAEMGDRLYKHKEYDQRGKLKKRVGWATTSKSKPLMIAELEEALRTGELRESDQDSLDQLLVYEYKDGASQVSGAPDGYHDDHVDALAIAWQMRKAVNRGVRSPG